MLAASQETQNFAAPQLPVEHRRALGIRSVNLENPLGQIQPDGDNHGTVPPLWRSNNDHVLATLMLLERAVPPHQVRRATRAFWQRFMPAKGFGSTVRRWTNGQAGPCFYLQPVGDRMRRHYRAILSDDRGHGGPGPPIVLFRYASGPSGAYEGHNQLVRPAPWTLVYCGSHLLRSFGFHRRRTRGAMP